MAWSFTLLGFPKPWSMPAGARLSAMRSARMSLADKNAVQHELQLHKRAISEDRAVAARLASYSELCTAANTDVPPERALLSIALDGMDQSKFRCQRNIAMTKEFESLWRPQLHLSVVVVHGVLEMYLLGDADLLKNSDANLSMISAFLRRWRNPVIVAVSLFSILLMSLPSQAWHWTRHLRSWPLVVCACPIIWWCRRTIRRASGTNIRSWLSETWCVVAFLRVIMHIFAGNASHYLSCARVLVTSCT